MKNIKEILSETNFTGSKTTRAMMAEQIKERWGEAELKLFDPLHNARTYRSWIQAGYKVRKNETALRSITFVETKDADGNVLKKIKKPCFLFYYRQVEKVTA